MLFRVPSYDTVAKELQLQHDEKKSDPQGVPVTVASIEEQDLSRAQARAWQVSWDRQQEAYMPDREHRFATMLDVAGAVAGVRGPSRVLDLAGGTGSISARLLSRYPEADVTVADLDPVLTHIAERSLPVTIVHADLREPGWADGLGRFDAVLTATALHWLTADRLTELYREIHDVVAPGGVFVNADHMPDPQLPRLSDALRASDRRRREYLYATGAAISWPDWWDRVAADPVLGPRKARRDELFSIHHSQEWLPDAGWHVDALQAAGFTEVGPVWRGGLDAAVAGYRTD
jgi:SAM-dependent methyltransferase